MGTFMLKEFRRDGEKLLAHTHGNEPAALTVTRDALPYICTP